VPAPDALIIAGDDPQEVLGSRERDTARLRVDGTAAALPFLDAYFRAGRDAAAARALLRGESAPFLSLNGAYLCQFLEARGFTAALAPDRAPNGEALRAALAAGPRAVVISTTFLPFAAQIDALAAFAKRHAPGAAVIAGGIQVWKSYRHDRLLAPGSIGSELRGAVSEHSYLMDAHLASPVDLFIVSNSGEETLARVLACLRDGGDARRLDNVAWIAGGKWRVNPVAPEPFHEVRVDWTRFLGRPTSAFVPVQAGLGCGFRCAFCDFAGLRPVRTRSLASLLEEIRTIPPCDGVRRVYFTDDNLFPTRRRAVELCRALIASGLGVRWRGLARVAVVDDETADLMARSGCLEVLLGVESGDPGMLRRMNKRVSPEQILSGIACLGRRGISTKSTFIVGFPGETEDTIRNTIALLNAYPADAPALHRYMFFLFAVLPLSAAAGPEARRRYGLTGYGYDWKHATMDAPTAARWIASMPDALKPELCPSYVGEVPELPGLDVETLKRVVVLRNRLAGLHRGRATAGAKAEELWDELERCFDRRTS